MIYTLGYSGWKPDAIRQFSLDHEALLVDIRYKPGSPHRQWRQGALKALVNKYAAFTARELQRALRTAQGCVCRADKRLNDVSCLLMTPSLALPRVPGYVPAESRCVSFA
jgi:hypothetical protein